MQKVIIRHLAGTKANQTETFELPQDAIIFGRAEVCQVVYDPVKDNLVSRTHLKITPDENNQFLLTDLNSTNGTFVNGQKVTNPLTLQAGDVVQLGKDGPKFEFDLDPRPKIIPKATMLSESILDLKSTRESQAGQTAESQSNQPNNESASAEQKRGVGRGTVERMLGEAEKNAQNKITEAEKAARRKMVNISAGLFTVIVLVVGYFVYQNQMGQQELQLTKEQLENNIIASNAEIAGMKSSAPISATEIFSRYGASAVYIETSWKLKHVETGKQLFHKTECAKFDARKRCIQELPVYLKVSDSVVEPYLVDGNGLPIGGTGSGSGFVVNESGFILTNRHVVAGWETSYSNPKMPGILVCLDNTCKPKVFDENDPVYRTLLNWVPTNTKTLGGKYLRGKNLEGDIDYLDVTLPKTTQRIPARLARVSETADVALIRIDVLESLPPVQIGANDSVTSGDQITVMGYPGISPDVIVAKDSLDKFSQERQIRTVPEPTVTTGNIGKVLRGKANLVSDSVSAYMSEFGDVYQLTINAAGAGNSGGPVFNDKGRVIGIFTAGKYQQGTMITFATPIKHGLDIMNIQKVIE
jgi:serine protease Do